MVNKITTPPTNNEVIDKVNEIIDNLGGGTSYTAGTGIDITNGIISVDGVQTSELSIDTTPTQNSSNLITSGGVYDVLGDIETLINAL